MTREQHEASIRLRVAGNTVELLIKNLSDAALQLEQLRTENKELKEKLDATTTISPPPDA